MDRGRTGSALIIVLVAIIIIAIVGGLWYYFSTQQIPSALSGNGLQNPTNSPTSTTVGLSNSSSLSGKISLQVGEGGLIALPNNDSVTIPKGTFSVNETISAAINKDEIEPANSSFKQLGDTITLSISQAVPPLAATSAQALAASEGQTPTSSLIKIVLNEKNIAGLDDSLPAMELITSDGVDGGTMAALLSGGYDSSTQQAVIYLDPTVFQIPNPNPASSTFIKTLVVGTLGIYSPQY